MWHFNSVISSVFFWKTIGIFGYSEKRFRDENRTQWQKSICLWVSLSSINRKRGERGRGKRKMGKSGDREEDGEGETGREGESSGGGGGRDWFPRTETWENQGSVISPKSTTNYSNMWACREDFSFKPPCIHLTFCWSKHSIMHLSAGNLL